MERACVRARAVCHRRRSSSPVGAPAQPAHARPRSLPGPRPRAARSPYVSSWLAGRQPAATLSRAAALSPDRTTPVVTSLRRDKLSPIFALTCRQRVALSAWRGAAIRPWGSARQVRPHLVDGRARPGCFAPPAHTVQRHPLYVPRQLLGCVQCPSVL